jgi:hypothetical protein
MFPLKRDQSTTSLTFEGSFMMEKNHYHNKLVALQEEILILKKTAGRLGIYRLLIFMGALLFFYALLGVNSGLAYAVLAIFTGGFILVYQRHLATNKKIKQKEVLKKVFENERSILEGKGNLFGDGAGFKDWQHAYAEDLDLFGSHSLFEWMNRSLTIEGKHKLAGWLMGKDSDKRDLPAQQEAVAELSHMEKFREKLLIESVYLNKEEYAQETIIQWFAGFRFHFQKIKKFSILLKFTSAVLLLLIPLAFVFDLVYIVLFAALILSMAFNFSYFRKVNQLHARISKQSELFGNYATLINIISKESFSAPKLRSIQKELNQPAQIVQELRKLAKLIEQLDYRLNAYVAFFLNLFFFWDIQKSISIEAWLMRNQHKVAEWLSPIAELDALLSISLFKFHHPSYTFPRFSDHKSVVISAKALGHPLIDPQQRVDNDYEISGLGHFDIITGSNMAGKTTFLRTLGINAVLAYIGAPVCAKEMLLSRFHIMTYMRITDSLEYNLSTFHSEIKRIRQILEFSQSQSPVLLLLDELLRGTNSKDRATGTQALIKQLIRQDASGLISTHDLGLTELEKEIPEKIRNFHFNIVNIDNDLDFDYKLKEGVSQTTNAAMLLKKIGLVL